MADNFVSITILSGRAIYNQTVSKGIRSRSPLEPEDKRLKREQTEGNAFARYRVRIFLNRLKMTIAHCLPVWVWNLRSRLRPERKIELSRLELLRTVPQEKLTDASALEKLIGELGLCGENMPWEIPNELSNYYDNGLLIWQYPNQFSEYLNLLRQYPIKTYLEIGVRHGGTFIATIEYLSRFTQLSNAIGVDINDSPGLREYMSMPGKKCDVDFHVIDSRSKEFKNVVRSLPTLDLVLIDGGHDEHTLRNDIEAVLSTTNIIVLHDTCSINHPAVVKVCCELKSELSGEFQFFDFHAQYDWVRKASGGLSFFGITVFVRNNWKD